MKTSLTRNVPYWALLVLSVASAAVGVWLIAGQIGTMTARLLDGTATNVEVYVGPSIVLVGAVLLGAGVVGILLALVLAAAKALLRAPAPVAESEDRTGPEIDAVENAAEDATETVDADGAAPAQDAEPALTR
ncbi:hypothetical protein [Microbacterium aurantiacum]|uniref:hypothetical protein n=1 Tax=Microbacterium aurantiacum TaxID=162393 RepID=UPI000C807957|nr:hypothetical protein [Microbacterium aurantiacum]